MRAAAAPVSTLSALTALRRLLSEAEIMANALAAQAGSSVSATLQRINQLAATGNAPMAGYLVYVNRWAFFVGRMELCQEQVAAVESALDRLRAELGQLHRKGLLA